MKINDPKNYIDGLSSEILQNIFSFIPHEKQINVVSKRFNTEFKNSKNLYIIRSKAEIEDFLKKKQNEKLTNKDIQLSLDLSNNQEIKDELVLGILAKYSDFTSINLSNTNITNETIRYITKNCPKLRELNIKDCDSLIFDLDNDSLSEGFKDSLVKLKTNNLGSVKISKIKG